MKSIWINGIFLLMVRSGFSQLQDTTMIEDQYNAALSEENGLELWNGPTINVNSPLQIKQLPIDLQIAISNYRNKYGCIANLQELYRIEGVEMSKWDSIMPSLLCGPCWHKPKFIDQSIIITAKDFNYPIDTSIIVHKYNIRYLGKSENGFRWGFHHFVTNNNKEKEILTTGFLQVKRKNSHIIIGDYLPQTPLHLLFSNNLMNSTAWNVAPLMAKVEHFVPYTSSIPNRHWRGAALSTTFKYITLKIATDLNTKLTQKKTEQHWLAADWVRKKFNIQYHYYANNTQGKNKNCQALNVSWSLDKSILQAEAIWQNNQWKFLAHWIQPILKNQWVRLSYQVDQSPILVEEKLTYVHQIFFHKKWKGLISVEQENSKGIWESVHEKEQTLRTQLDYSPTRYHIFYLRYQVRKNSEMSHQLRCDGQWKIDENSKAHCRIEQHILHHSVGWLSAIEYDWKPMNKPWQIVIRQIFFAIPDWDLRIYMMDRELKGGMSIPAYSGRGKRTFLIAQYQYQSWRWAIKLERHNPIIQERFYFINVFDLQLVYCF
jgi:hypothetical protein